MPRCAWLPWQLTTSITVVDIEIDATQDGSMDGQGVDLRRWLREGDPAVRWQALQNLDGAPASRSHASEHAWPPGVWVPGCWRPKTPTAAGVAPSTPRSGHRRRRRCCILCGWACRPVTPPHCAVANCYGSGRHAGGCRRPASSASWYDSPATTPTTHPGTTTCSQTYLTSSCPTVGGTAPPVPTRRSTARSTPAFRRWKRSMLHRCRRRDRRQPGAAPRARVPPAPSAVPVPSHRRGRHPWQHPIPRLSRVALRRAPWSRILRRGRRAAR
jgi:hypothetical protein